jgi:hypothetical protein
MKCPDCDVAMIAGQIMTCLTGDAPADVFLLGRMPRQRQRVTTRVGYRNSSLKTRVRADQRASTAFRLELAEREMTWWLARPSPPKSGDVSRRAGCRAEGGYGGVGGHPRTAQKAHQSSAGRHRGATRFPKPVLRHGSNFAPASSRDILVFKDIVLYS